MLMNKIQSAFIIVIVLMLGFSANKISAQRFSPKDIVNVSVSASGKEEIVLKVNLEIKEGWHINSDKPFDDYLTPTSISIKDSTVFTFIKTTFPPPEIAKLEFSQSELSLFQEMATIDIVLKPIESNIGKEIVIEGEVSYQPCNDQTCLFPTKKPFSLTYKPE